MWPTTAPPPPARLRRRDRGPDGRRRVIARFRSITRTASKTDSAGRIYASFGEGIRVLAPSGDLLGEIRLRGAVNFCFGTPDRNVLFITTDDAIWAAELAAKGA